MAEDKLIKTVCVCGAGTMGSGIAQLAAQAGFSVIQYDVNEAMLLKSKELIEHNLSFLVDKKKIDDEQKNQILERIFFTNNEADCKADIIIEAIIENKDAKIELFNGLEKYNDASTIYATNTSSIAVSEIAEGVQNADHVIGMHFFNPAPIMKLVEVIKAKQTAETVVQQVFQLAKAFNKIPVVCKDAPGFIVNRVARQYYLEALQLIEDEIATIENVDEMMEATGFKMGPFRLMDLIGIDINYSVSNIVYEALGKPERLKPSGIQHQKVTQKLLGRKSGEGFYQY